MEFPSILRLLPLARARGMLAAFCFVSKGLIDQEGGQWVPKPGQTSEELQPTCREADNHVVVAIARPSRLPYPSRPWQGPESLSRDVRGCFPDL